MKRSLFGGLAIAAAAAAVLSLVVAIVKAPLPGDLWLLETVQKLEWLRRPAEVVNTLGDFDLLLLIGVAAAMAWEVREGRNWRQSGLFAGAAFITATALMPLDEVMKEIVRSPRPSPADGVTVLDTRTTFGFPSGHTYTVTLLIGLAAICTRRLNRPSARWWRLAALVVIPAAGIARLVVGAHWPSDVVGGWLWGGAAILLCLLAGQDAQRRLGQATRTRRRSTSRAR